MFLSHVDIDILPSPFSKNKQNLEKQKQLQWGYYRKKPVLQKTHYNHCGKFMLFL